MQMKKLIALLLVLLLSLGCTSALAETLESLPMDQITPGPAPKDENYLSDREYRDETISVKITEGRFADTNYVCAHVKISHPSQLRTAPASIVTNPNAYFGRNASENNFRARHVAQAVNAVLAINGDFYTKTDLVKVVLRQSTQVRNISIGISDLLIIDKNGDFSYLPLCSQRDYQIYYEEHKEELYQVFCFGPVMVLDGVSIIDDNYRNNSIGSYKNTQRAAICQLGPLEYMLLTCNSNQIDNNKGMTIQEFAALCEEKGRELNPENGCLLAYNLDGGNSATLVFKEKNEEYGTLAYAKVNCPEIERSLGDIIYFATLVK